MDNKNRITDLLLIKKRFFGTFGNIQFLFLTLSLILIWSCSSENQGDTEMIWDTWGVPHIYANNDKELFYAEGWAQMQLHGNLILELYGRSRGRSAEYWGEEHLPDDILIHTLGLPEIAQEWWKIQDPELKGLIESFVAGMNAYAGSHPESFKAENKIVLPIQHDDINLHYLFVIYTRFVGGSELGRINQWSDMGSNTWAIAPSRSTSGNAMLVQNPHLPWWGEFLFIEMHLNLPGHNIYGSTLIGFPMIAIAFNENLGWSHTNNTIDNADTYELALKDGGYLLDGKRQEFEKTTKTLKIKDKNGGLTDQAIEILHSVYGRVISKGNNKALAIRMAGLDRPNAILQWWHMANAKNFDEFEHALKMMQIPFFNIMYADKLGNIFYLFNGQVPKRQKGDWYYWNRIIPGGNSEDIWKITHSYEDLPKLKNPASGWLQNANDPPWTCTIPMLLDPKKFPAYMSPPMGMHLRAQRSARMLMEDNSITFDELIGYKLSTRFEMADRLLDDLFVAINQYGSETAKEAGIVLKKWDRQADSASTGTMLFYTWARKMVESRKAIFAGRWDENDPLNTPDGLADPKTAVRLLQEAATGIKTNFGRLDVPWGKAYRLNYNNIDLPGNGAGEFVGVFRVADAGYQKNHIQYINSGDSWVGLIEFGKKIKAKVLLSYGNATQADSPHNGDQLKLFSEKKLRDALFYREDLQSNIKSAEILKDGKFIPE
jgi:acyl-homoserine-lactone acylase